MGYDHLDLIYPANHSYLVYPFFKELINTLLIINLYIIYNPVYEFINLINHELCILSNLFMDIHLKILISIMFTLPLIKLNFLLIYKIHRLAQH
jgi:hypothetical protein